MSADTDARTAEDCLFCQIVAGDIPSYTVYEDDETYAFLDVNPVSAGHTLVIPKEHGETMTDLGEATVGRVFETVRTVAGTLDTALDSDGLNILQNNGDAAGQEIEHMHVHLIPRYVDGDGFSFDFDQGDLDETAAEDLLDALQQQLP